MKELQAIIDQVLQSKERSTAFALATVVKTIGSSYRRPGARMLIASTGERIGTISGGCLEQDVAEHAKQVLQLGEARLVTYDSTADEDIVWGFGLGCNGVIQMLIERLDIQNAFNPIHLIHQGLQTQQSSILVSVFQVEGLLSTPVGARLLLSADGAVLSNVVDPQIRQAAIADAQKALQSGESFTRRYSFAEGELAALVEVIHPAIPLVIFGAGHDALPVVQFAKSLGWHVTVVDCRAQEASFARFSVADQVIMARRNNLHQLISISAQTVAVVMTHNYLDDLAILTHLLASPFRYIGCLGPRSRFNRLLHDLSQAGVNPTSEQRKRVYAPIGLDIGADTPEAIAFSILAEIQKVLTNRSGQSLCDRQGSIHPPFVATRFHYPALLL